MPNTNRGYPYETGADQPGHSLTGGSDGDAPILAQVVDADVQAIDNRLTTGESDIGALEGRMDTAESGITSLDSRVTANENDIATNTGNLAAHEAATTSVHGIVDTAALIVEGDPRLSDAREPTAHAATHATGGTDPVTAASIDAFPDTGGVLDGDLELSSNDLTVARSDGTAGFRVRSSDGSVGFADYDYNGQLVVYHWAGDDFTGAQTGRQRWHSAGVTYAGVVSFSDDVFTSLNSIDAGAGTAMLGGKNDAEPFTLCGRLTTSGAPAAGTWDAGDLVIDVDGVWHLCTAGGTPGTWT